MRKSVLWWLHTLRATGWGIIASLVLSCGAPTKSASDVGHLFRDEAAQTLQDKLTEICQTLKTNPSGPSLKNLRLNVGNCPSAGQIAPNYKNLEAFHFLGLEGLTEQSKELTELDVRGQVWLNKSLLGLATSISKFMKAKKEGGGESDGLVALPQGGANISGLIKPTIRQSNVNFDIENRAFQAEVHFVATGIVDVDMNLEIKGGLIDKRAFAVTVRTTRDAKFEKSLVKSLEALVIMVPHASDIYMDLHVALKLHKIGFVDDLLEQRLNSFLSTGFKGFIDTALQL